MNTRNFSIVLWLLPFAGCVTDKHDVATSEREAEQKTLEAYDRADEKALKAEEKADEKAEAIIEEADKKLEKVEKEAEASIAAAYSEAEKTEDRAAREVAESRQKQFVLAMSERLEKRRSEIHGLERSTRQQPQGVKEALEPQLQAAKASEKAAAEELAFAKRATPQGWENFRPRVEDAFAKLDQDVRQAENRVNQHSRISH